MGEYTVKLNGFKMKDVDEYVVSTDYKLKNCKEEIWIICNEEAGNKKETHPSILREAIRLAIPEHIVSPYCTDEIKKVIWKTAVLFSYYTDKQFMPGTVIEIDKKKLDLIQNWFSRLSKRTQEKETIKTQWNFALQEYLDTCDTSSLEQNYIHLITSLEALLVYGNKGVIGKTVKNTVTLCAKDEEEQKRIKRIVKRAYDIRNSAVHGDLDKLVKKLERSNAFAEYFEFRKVVADVLYRSYGKEKKDLVMEILKQKV